MVRIRMRRYIRAVAQLQSHHCHFFSNATRPFFSFLCWLSPHPRPPPFFDLQPMLINLFSIVLCEYLNRQSLLSLILSRIPAFLSLHLIIPLHNSLATHALPCIILNFTPDFPPANTDINYCFRV